MSRMTTTCTETKSILMIPRPTPSTARPKSRRRRPPSGVHAWVKSVANGTTGGNAPAGNSSGAFQCMGPSGGSGAGGADNRKRRHSGADGRDVDEGRGNGHGKRPKLGEKGQRNANYACPFSKRYPPNLLPTACRKGWPEVRLVKQHLYRHHVHERCPRCHATFRSIDQLNKHLCLEQQCPIIPDPGTSIGIDRETKIKVKSRVGIQRQPEHVRWTNLYKILFPNSDEVPSPYCDVSLTSTLPNNELLQLLHGNLSESVPYEIDRKLSDYQPSLGISPSHLEIIKHVCKEVMNAKFSVFTESLEETGGVPQTTSPDLVPEVGPPSTAAENTQFAADESTHMNGGDDNTLSQFMDSMAMARMGTVLLQWILEQTLNSIPTRAHQPMACTCH
ncbi:hypothetical protein BN1723_004118 [Verticillium longisporum]|uniref:C2H2-type domain-containing protein n=1 Tax=Verticillium longisporum TaxID=100787 RepID=A0A0G4MMR6_VERLO|nr:hypothetical protein BN1723_004118 [Verticillium longisporum]